MTSWHQLTLIEQERHIDQNVDAFMRTARADNAWAFFVEAHAAEIAQFLLTDGDTSEWRNQLLRKARNSDVMRDDCAAYLATRDQTDD